MRPELLTWTPHQYTPSPLLGGLATETVKEPLSSRRARGSPSLWGSTTRPWQHSALVCLHQTLGRALCSTRYGHVSACRMLSLSPVQKDYNISEGSGWRGCAVDCKPTGGLMKVALQGVWRVLVLGLKRFLLGLERGHECEYTYFKWC